MLWPGIGSSLLVGGKNKYMETHQSFFMEDRLDEAIKAIEKAFKVETDAVEKFEQIIKDTAASIETLSDVPKQINENFQQLLKEERERKANVRKLVDDIAKSNKKRKNR